MIKIKYILLLFLLPLFSDATTVTDSLKTLLTKANSDTAKVKALLELAEDARSYNTDEALKYADRALSLAQKITPKNFEVNAIVKKALILKSKGEYENGLELLFKAYDLANKIHYYKGKLKAMNNIGVAYSEIGNRKKATEYYLAAIAIAENARDKKSLSSLYANVAVDFMETKQYNKALEFLKKTQLLAAELNDHYSGGSVCTNIGSIFSEQAKYDSALYYYNQGLMHYRAIEYVEGVALTYYYFGTVQKKKGDYTAALVNYKRAYVMIDSLKIDNEKPNLLLNIAEIESVNKQYAPALQHSLLALELAKQYKFAADIKEAYKQISGIYSETNKFKEAYYYQKLYYKLKDSLGGTESNKAFFEMQAKFESEKKQKAIEILNQNKKLQETEIQHKNSQRNGLVGIVVLAILLIVFVLFALVKIKKAHKTVLAQKGEIEEKNEALNKRNKEIATQRDEIQNKNEELNQQNEEIAAQRDEIENQKHLIEEKQKEVLDSINYAQKIQQTLLPALPEIQEIFPESFIIYKPKDIVAGDFYWMHATQLANETISQLANDEMQANQLINQSANRLILLATADCTGHGVPGAFMSMLGMSFLNEIVAESKITQPDLVLNKLRDNIIKAISSQKINSKEELKDGMDMTLIAYNIESKQMQMSAANNSLYVLRPRGKKGLICNKRQMLPITTIESGALYEIKANKFPIGKQNEILEPFTLNTIQLEEGDTVILYTDGYADQFGGANGKKFKYKQLEDLIMTNAHLSMNEQANILNDKFETWKGKLEQVDDVTVIGIRI